MHNLMYGDEYKGKGYDQRFEGIQFKENVISGYNDEGEELTQDSKGYAANELAKLIQEKRIILSEVDHEGLSQLERVAKQRSTNGKDRYFVINSKGAGADEDDHIFASFICFVLGIRHAVSNPSLKRLAKTQGKYT